MKKILILGDGEAGKDTLANHLTKHTNLTCESSSKFAFDTFIWNQIKNFYDSRTLAYKDRRNNRILWLNLIRAYNRNNKARMAKELLEQYDIYCGMRDYNEFEETLTQNLVDTIIYVEANTRVKKDESNKIPLHKIRTSISKNCNIIVLQNNETEEQFLETINNMIKRYF